MNNYSTSVIHPEIVSDIILMVSGKMEKYHSQLVVAFKENLR